MKILLTGGAGFIGSHTLIELTEAGHEAVVVDNLDNSSPISLKRVAKIIGKEVPFYKVDIRDREGLQKVFDEHKFDACIHFAGLKAVGESCAKPLEYYENNMNGTFVLVDVMRKNGCKNMIFSSSATVYGDPAIIPITEECPKGHCTNPYGQTKSMLEEVLMDVQKADNEWNIVLLRYFNPIGAHKSGTIGEDPKGIPNNLLPYVTQVASGKREYLSVFGNDYNIHDGTGVRDYIHVVDLARGHACAIDYASANKGVEVFNLGTSVGYSVLDMVNAFETANGVKVNYKIAPRREGDIAECYAALSISDPNASALEMKEGFERAVGRIKCALLSPAVKGCSLDGIDIKRGDTVGIIRNKIVTSDKKRIGCALTLIGMLVSDESSLLTVFRGKGADRRESRKITDAVRERYPRLEVYEIYSAEEIYPYIFSAE